MRKSAPLFCALLLSLSARRAWIEILASRLSDMSDASLSARRAWIEIIDYIIDYVNDAVALRKESVDRNRLVAGSLITLGGSLSARRAWIEISVSLNRLGNNLVALRKESVDRNDNGNAVAVSDLVALRKESVDRNLTWHCMSEDVSVALRKESVDRNLKRSKTMKNRRKSLSARRAWIEIITRTKIAIGCVCRSPQGERG